jgi:hypothetical protein
MNILAFIMLGVKSVLAIVFIASIIIGTSVSTINNIETSMPSNLDKNLLKSILIPKTKFSPSDRITEKDIRVYNKRIIINLDKAILARFTDTKSMEPLINKDTNAIEIIPKDIDEINVGDIISYRSNLIDGTIMHRVIEKSKDEKGPYLRTKGDNLKYQDPEKIRFQQVQRVVVGILY